MSEATKKSFNKKRIAIITILACFVLIGTVIGVKAFFGSKADESVTSKKESDVVNDYYDEEYKGKAILDIDDQSVQDILECYENEELDMTVNDDFTMVYNVTDEMKSNVVSASAAVCLEKKYEADIDEENTAILYLGSMGKCDYNAESGEVKTQYDYKTLMLDNGQPLATYEAGTYEGNMLLYTPMFVNDEEEASLLAVTLEKDNTVAIQHRIITHDEEGNPLEEVKEEKLENGTKVYPAYENYIVKKASIDEAYINATELYEVDKSYELGKDLNIKYDNLKDGEYLYNCKLEYAATKEENDDTSEEQVLDSKYCLYTDQQEIKVADNKIVESKVATLEDINIDDYKLLSIGKFLKLVWKNAKRVPKADMKQIYQHKLEGYDVVKGYISAWNSLDINKALRSDDYDSLDDDDKATVDVLQKHCMNNVFDENVLAVRNVGATFLTSLFGTQYKGQDLTDELVKASGDKACMEIEKDLKENIVGKKILEKGFMSVSLVPKANIMIKRTVRLMIMAPKGTKAYTTVNVGESEAILPMNSNLIVKSVSYDKFKNKFIIYCLVEQNF